MFIEENCTRQSQALSSQQRDEFMGQIPHWQYDEIAKALSRTFKFSAYADGPAFAVKVGAMADAQNHHPDLHIYYKKCVVAFTTHSAGGVSRNDFICAAKTDLLYSS